MIVRYTLYPENVQPMDEYALSVGAEKHDQFDEMRRTGSSKIGPSERRTVCAYRVAPDKAILLDKFVIALAKTRAVDAL